MNYLFKIFFAIFTFLFLIGCSPSVDDGFEYMKQDNDTYAVVDYVGTDVNIILPYKFNNKEVTAVYLGNFKNIESIHIPKNINYIVVNTSGFDGLKNLKRITVEKENKYFISLEGVLYSKDKQKLILYPNKLGLSTYEVPSSVREIGERAFLGNDSIEEISFSKELETIKKGAFKKSGIRKFNFKNGLLTIEDEAFAYIHTADEFILPDSVVMLGNKSFYSSTFKTLIIPKNLKELKYQIFANTKGLEEIDIPKGITYITPNIFGGDSTVKKVNVSVDNQNYESINGVVYSKDLKTLILYPNAKEDTIFVIPDSVEIIGDGAINNKNITELVIGESVKMIGNIKLENLKTLKIHAPKPPILSSNFDKNLEEILVLDYSVNLYKTTTGWSLYKEIISINE